MTSSGISIRLAVLGIGLLGSSIAHAVKAYGGAETGGACGMCQKDVRTRAARVLDCEITETAEAAVAGADCVILCTPVGVAW